MIEEPIKYIQKVEIQGLWGRYDIEWNLYPDVNVLAGINGSGKTTILNAIYKVICNEKLKNNYVIWSLLRDIKILFDNGVEVNKHSINPFNYPNIIVDHIGTFDTELKPLEAVQKLSDERVKTELDWELSQLQIKYLEYKLDLGRKQTTLMESNPENMKAEFERIRHTHIRFLTILNELFFETGKYPNLAKNQLEFLLGNKEINTYQLSSGEKQLLVILLTVLVQDNKPSILLMDEPEISLHIEWQRKLIKYIRELNPNAQIIIATHSPDIIVHGWLDKVFNLQDLIVKDNAIA